MNLAPVSACFKTSKPSEACRPGFRLHGQELMFSRRIRGDYTTDGQESALEFSLVVDAAFRVAGFSGYLQCSPFHVPARTAFFCLIRGPSAFSSISLRNRLSTSPIRRLLGVYQWGTSIRTAGEKLAFGAILQLSLFANSRRAMSSDGGVRTSDEHRQHSSSR